jgi:Flp pilus assembly protein TadD
MWRTTAFFILGLMAKPALVFLPLALLLFDYWPLRRWDPWEKWPLFAAAAVSSLITVQGQDAFGATKALGDVPLALRIGHALTNTALYLWRTVWPSGLAVVYPYDFQLASWKPLAAGVALVAVTGAAWFWRAKWPAAAVGWGWYLLALAPVSGVIQAGPQSGADRFTYLPMVGIMLALTAAGARITTPGLAAAVVCAYLSFVQIGHWKDSVTVFTHAVEVTDENWIAMRNLGNGLIAAGRVPEGIARFKESLLLRPNQPETCYQLGSALAGRSAWAEAIPYFERSVSLKPDYGSAQFALGLALLQTGRQAEAKPALEKAVKLELADNYKADAYNNLGVMEVMRGDAVSAQWHFREAVRLNPGMAGAKQNLQRIQEQLKVK